MKEGKFCSFTCRLLDNNNMNNIFVIAKHTLYIFYLKSDLKVEQLHSYVLMNNKEKNVFSKHDDQIY